MKIGDFVKVNNNSTYVGMIGRVTAISLVPDKIITVDCGSGQKIHLFDFKLDAITVSPEEAMLWILENS